MLKKLVSVHPESPQQRRLVLPEAFLTNEALLLTFFTFVGNCGIFWVKVGNFSKFGQNASTGIHRSGRSGH